MFCVDGGFFMYCSTISGKEGDSAIMQSTRMDPKRRFQCLQFFYVHSGSDKDQLNIWIREYVQKDKSNSYLVDQITGGSTSMHFMSKSQIREVKTTANFNLN